MEEELSSPVSGAVTGSHVSALLQRTGKGECGAFSKREISVLSGETYQTVFVGSVPLTLAPHKQLRAVVGVMDFASKWMKTGDALPLEGTFGQLMEASVAFRVPPGVSSVHPFVAIVSGGTDTADDRVMLMAAPVTHHVGTALQLSDPSDDASVFESLGNGYVEHRHDSGLASLALTLGSNWAPLADYNGYNAIDGGDEVADWPQPFALVAGKLCALQGAIQGSSADVNSILISNIPRTCWPKQRIASFITIADITVQGAQVSYEFDHASSSHALMFFKSSFFLCF
jgi:hypothetical protein